MAPRAMGACAMHGDVHMILGRPISAVLPWLAQSVDVPVFGVALTRRSMAIFLCGILATALRIYISHRATAKAKEKERLKPKEPDVADIFDFGQAALGALGAAAAATIKVAADTLEAAPKDTFEQATDRSIGEMLSNDGPAEPVGEQASGTDADEANEVALQTMEGTDDEDERPAFISANKFAGAKPGYIFKNGEEGKGYYSRDYE
eukprot:CAMPEP_0115847856 /NCGR_PEP_ID=MMETSP0287-20121206/10608_1 /TAXON_ID=412157 /ORGANISM="Chrysochromulina rotalis, Strain UIO044" /LENGTH=205 /DNA_ID=CAMNT_0003301723 /DNA_START=96 /DNA_END=713 /DNA_ORIENTATION=+